MTSDVIIKNLAIPQFENHINVFLEKTGTLVAELPMGECQKRKM